MEVKMRPFYRNPALSLIVVTAALMLGLLVPAQAQAAAQSQAQTADKDLSVQIDKLLSDVYKPGAPGAAVLVKKQGRVILRKGYGLANLELNVPVEPDMVFRLGSITKQFTAVSILMLAEEGKLSLQDEITKFLPDYPAQGKTITVENLLTHTSGIKSYTDLEEWLPLQRKDMTVAEIIDLAKNKPMEFAPGERWKYCNSGYILLGAIIEKASGKTYADFLQERIFGPLGMKSSCYDSTSRIIPRRASGYAKGNAGFENAPYLSMTQPYAAGSLASSVDDLAVWTESLLAGKLVKRETLEKAFTSFKLKDGSETGYGYGWSVSRYEGHRLIEHGGGIHGFLSYALFFPEDDIFVALLTNVTARETQPEPLAFRAGCLALGIPYKEPVPISLPEKDLAPLTGVYVNAAGDEVYITLQDGRLFAQPAGESKSEIKPVSAVEFFFTETPARAQFLKDEKGAVTGLKVTARIGPVQSFKKTDKPLPAPRKEVKLDPAIYDQYVGEYELAPGFTVILSKEDGKLMGQATGQPKVELFPESETKFFLKVVDGQLEIVKDAAGKVTGIILFQGGQRLPGKKIR
jgi:CubicO group peptidase (beta-lactamase class C family)